MCPNAGDTQLLCCLTHAFCLEAVQQWLYMAGCNGSTGSQVHLEGSWGQEW